MIISVLDSGIATNNPSVQALPEPRPDAVHQVTCNNKVIGAQYFNKGLVDPTETDWLSPMDSGSHGTHTATTAAGDIGVPAALPDSGISGRISGLAPHHRGVRMAEMWKPCARLGSHTRDGFSPICGLGSGGTAPAAVSTGRRTRELPVA
ncbi:hypothetical protein SALBM311S_09846 [Streptomyces alboniger]